MSEAKSLTDEQLQQLVDAVEIRIETEEGGKAYSTTIWVVVVDGAVFVRSYLGERGRWYQRTLRTGSAVIRWRSTTIPVRVEPELDAGVNRQVDDAYRQKYGRRWPEETQAMVKSEVVQTTLRLLPRSGRALSPGTEPAE